MVPENRDPPDDQGTNTFANLAAQIKSKQRTKAFDGSLKNKSPEKNLSPAQKIIQKLPPAPEKSPLQPSKHEPPPGSTIKPVALGSSARSPLAARSPEAKATFNPMKTAAMNQHRRPPPNAVARATQPQRATSPPHSYQGAAPSAAPVQKSAVPQNLPDVLSAAEDPLNDAGQAAAPVFPGHYQGKTQKPPSPSTSLTPARDSVATAERGLSAEQLYTMAKMGYTQWEYGKLERAQAIFQTLVTQKPDEPWFRCALGSIFQKQRQFAQAIQQYNIALQLDPKDIPSRVNRGEILLKVGKNREAYADLSEAVKLDTSGKHPSALRARSLLAALKHQLPG